MLNRVRFIYTRSSPPLSSLIVCTFCRSPAGVPTCHACLSANLPRPAAILDPAHADSPGDMDSIDTSNGVPISIADYDFSDLPMDDD